MILLLLACADPGPAKDSAPVTTLPARCGAEPGPPDVQDPGPGPEAARTISGTAVWTLEFDAVAEAAGYHDCSYTRSYGGLETLDQPWLCPDCDVTFAATATMTSGYEDCFLQIDSANAERTEYLGFGELDDGVHLFRSSIENVLLSDLAAGTEADDTWTGTWTDTTTADTGGTMVLTGSATLKLGVSDEVIEGIDGALTTPSACGWPRNSPGGPSPLRTLVTDGIVPNARLDDQCSDPVDLWDFRGYYLVIDASSPDCGPCQALAGSAEAARSRLLADCIPVEMVTLLNASLSAVNEPAEPSVRGAWMANFGLRSPVLGDRGYGYALFPSYLGDEGFSLPSVIVVRPDGTLLGGGSGVDSEDPFGIIEEMIREDAE